ncbi:iron complex outermembrane receptor protein [Hymenobacter luteus]|uniref:Iron complex outermembrane receptor protein n=2 Tax=Hymenobacter TaxID=89966 RepID=A0A7W9WCY3_9BACT|nr:MULTISPECIES: TonB-dependent receptor [Hymenobacter]MBB4601567.1 iron complex outermembrane receptor protein [Hymenobacter latericoloratus]MBB6060005.1 iron complex outermembrane receptor protein [Hymenobacter luteus]
MNTLQRLGLVSTLTACSLSAVAQQAASIRGTVTTADGQPAEAVTVGLKGRSQGAITNGRGQYTIDRVRDGEYTVVVSAVGLKSEEKTVTVSGGQGVTLDFMLTESAQQLKEVVVNGARVNRFARKQSVDVNKMPLDNLENPQVYATVGKELLTEQVVFSVDDATRNAPGLQKMWDATGRGGDGGAFYAARGFVTQSQLRNGVAGNVTGNIDAVNLEKLEVIKGPSATLFGSALTSYGGLINRVTKKPLDTFGGEINVAAGSYGFHRVSADVNLVDQNTPADQLKTVGFRLNTAYTYEDNFQNQGYTGFNKNLAVAPSLQWRPSDRLTVNLDAEIYKGRGTGNQFIFLYFAPNVLGFDRADQSPFDYRQSYQGPGLLQDSRSTNLFGQVQYKISPAFTSTTYLTSSNSYSNGNSAYFYLTPSTEKFRRRHPELPAADNYLVRADQSTDNSQKQLWEVQQLFNGDFQVGNMRNRVVLGLDFLRIDSDVNFVGANFDTVALASPRPVLDRFNGPNMNAVYASGGGGRYLVTTKSNTYSAFISDVLNLTEQLSVLAALRVDHVNNKGGLYYSPVAAYKQTTFSPKFGLVYQPVKERVSVFANYQNSFNNLGIYLAADGSRPLARPERANQWEGGVKLDAAGGRLSATVSYYDIRVQDRLRLLGYAPTTFEAINAQDATQRSKGVEVNFTANPVPGLNMVGGFSYNDSKFEDSPEDVNGRRPNTASSPYLANAWVSYRQPEGALRGLGAGIGGNYASENRVQNSSTNVFILPSYTIFNASLFYDQPKYRISAKVDNLTDQRYWTGYTTMNPQKLRSIIGSVAYKF